MKQNRPPVPQAFDSWADSAGLSKKSGAWYLRGDTVISVTELQKSQYGPQYYINQGFWIRRLGLELFPKSHKCHITMRANSLYPLHLDELHCLLDEECGMADAERLEKLTRLLDSALLGLIRQGSSLDGLRTLRSEGSFAAAGIRGPALQLLAE